MAAHKSRENFQLAQPDLIQAAHYRAAIRVASELDKSQLNITNVSTVTRMLNGE